MGRRRWDWESEEGELCEGLRNNVISNCLNYIKEPWEIRKIQTRTKKVQTLRMYALRRCLCKQHGTRGLCGSVRGLGLFSRMSAVSLTIGLPKGDALANLHLP